MAYQHTRTCASVGLSADTLSLASCLRQEPFASERLALSTLTRGHGRTIQTCSRSKSPSNMTPRARDTGINSHELRNAFMSLGAVEGSRPRIGSGHLSWGFRENYGQKTPFRRHGVLPAQRSPHFHTDHCLYQSLCVHVSMTSRSFQDRSTHREGIQPLLHHLDFPQMRLHDEVWFRVNIQDPIAVPMVSASIDKIRLDLAGCCGITVWVRDAIRRRIGQG
jgi:hypothetical protein